MSFSAQYLNPSEAARLLGVSAKALRLYEQRGLVTPTRTASGWRTYGPSQIERAREVVALRGLGLSLAQVERVLGGDAGMLIPVLAAHQARLEEDLGQSYGRIERIAQLRGALERGRAPGPGELLDALGTGQPLAAFDLPWPWGGERFELREMGAITFIVGPLFSGKTRLARAIAENLPGFAFVDLERQCESTPTAALDEALGWLDGEGATRNFALVALATALTTAGPAGFVVDMVEQGLDQASQEAVIAWLRQRSDRRPLFLMTRSTAILDLEAARTDEPILFCPANHAPPFPVLPFSGAPGFEAMSSCLASPDVRARSEGVVAVQRAG